MNRKWIGLTVLAVVAALAAIVAVPVWLIAGEVEEHHDRREEVHGYLGVSTRSLSTELRVHFQVPDHSGVLVASVEDGGPADEAGIRVGDVLTELDGWSLDSSGDLRRAVRRRAGERVDVELYRDGEARLLGVTIGERRASRHGHGHWDIDFDSRHWEEMGEQWARFGEEMGEHWGEWGEEMGERWGEWGEEMGERWGERGEEWGEQWGAIGARIGVDVAQAVAEMDWEGLGEAIEGSMEALEAVDWDEIGEEIERSLEGVDEEMERSLEELERTLEEMEQRLEEMDEDLEEDDA